MRASVLIADDDTRIRKALSQRIEHWGHDVWTASDGKEALETARNRGFDIILLDLNMPNHTGLEVLQRLRREGNGATIVVLTAHGSLQSAVDAMKLGADDFLSKPADLDVLRAVVDRSLEKGRLRRVNDALSDQLASSGPIQETLSQAMEAV